MVNAPLNVRQSCVSSVQRVAVDSGEPTAVSAPLNGR